ncbi:armadillo-type protein [Dunaliella salina]|uniref:Armadillo-type protein n=1 Tax=Dunaliella salina TaxID=3046 RepID=A0ABQ7GJ79_DUNSA|nr:armadillo-type protein [Dunaliella salina]|eukprot:KAF5834660.1 armadillo-type protein [Dunaliella salina]
MLSPPSYSPVKRTATPPSIPHGLGGTSSPSKVKRSPIAPLWSRSPQGHTHAPSTHVAHASSSARRGLFSGSGDEGMEGGGRAGAGTPVNHRWPAHQCGQGTPQSPAHAARGSLAGSASAASSADTSPTAAAAAAATSSAMEWGVQGATSIDSAHSSCGAAEEDGSQGPPPFNLGGIASSAQHVAAAVLRAGAGALLQGSNTSGELGGSHAQGKLGSELARRTARSLTSTPDEALGLDHPGEGHVQWVDQTEHAGSSAREGARGLRDPEEGQLGVGGMPQGMGSAQASARRAQLLVAYLEGEDNGKVQGALLLLLDHLKTRKLSPEDLIDAGAVPLLASLIACHCTGPAATASLTSPAAAPGGGSMLPGSGDDALEQASTALAALEVVNALVALPAQVPAEAKGALVPLVGPVLQILGANAVRLASQDTDLGAAGLAESGRDEPEWPRLPIAFFAGNIVVRLSVFDQPAAALVRGGAVSILTANLAALPTVLPQVCVFALYKLLQVGSNADNLSVLLQEGGAHGLVTFMGSSGNKKGDPAACELAATILLSLALLPEAPQSAADTNLVAPLVKLLGPSSPSPAVRMYALLILGRLASRCSAVQMDLAREGAVPFLVSLMGPEAQEEEQLHAARLTAILAQATPTHQMLQSHDVMDALLGLLQSSKPAVVEHAASVFSVLANNPATHFQVVGWGAVPLLVRLLQPPPPHASIGLSVQHAEDSSSIDALPVDNDHSPKAQTNGAPKAQTLGHSPKAQTYALATLLLLAMHETRHADVICRTGAIPNLVRLVKEGGSPSVQEYAAAVLACMAHTVDVQVDIITSGGIPALVSLLDQGGPEAQASAAEVLVTLSAVDHHRKRLITRCVRLLSECCSTSHV